MRTVRGARVFLLSSVFVLSAGTPSGLAQEAPGPVIADALAPGPAVEREMAGGDVHAYQVELSTGQFLRVIVDQRGIDVVVTVIGPDGGVMAEVDSPTGAEGAETVDVATTAPGAYRLEIRPFQEEGGMPPEAGRYAVRIDQLLSPEEYAERLAAERAKLEAVKRWLADHAIPLRTVEAGHGFEDMQPLRGIVGDARLVALGEATHGTREFFQLKHRMLEFLVSEMGFTVFAIEATMPEAFDVNEYVLTGEGDAAKALAGLYFWTWNTEEVLDMIEWMREYNSDPSHAKKVKFYGFDMQFPQRAARVTLDYLREVDPNQAENARSAIASLANPYTLWNFTHLSAEEKQTIASSVDAVIRSVDEGKNDYVARTSLLAWEVARQHVEVLAQNVAMMRGLADAPNESFGVRDSAMAENIRWILEREGPETKMVLWAHNGHVSTEAPWMGSHLRRVFGADMVVLGFAFNQGSFQAIELPMPSRGGLRSFDVDPAPEGSLDAMLAAAGLDLAAIDLRALPESGPVAEWFAEPHRTHDIGAGYGEELASAFLRPQKVADRYDALLFVESTTAARPNPGGRRGPFRTLTTPANLDFEEGDTDEVPVGWSLGPALSLFDDDTWTARDQGFEIHPSAEGAYEGHRSALLSRAPGRHYGETVGELVQRIEATQYRGKRIRMRVAARSEDLGPESEAHVWFRATKKLIQWPPTTVSFQDWAITDSEWQEHEVVIDVPGDAEMIDYGMALVGDGRVWIDAISIEVAQE